MSLILDALKKSEAERRRGLPPGLNTPFSAPRRRRHMPWVAGAGAVLLAAGVASGWVLLNRSRDNAAPDLAAVPAAPGDSGSLVSAAAPGVPATSAAAGAPLPVALASAESQAELQQTYGGLAGNGNGGSVSGGGLPTPERAGLFTPSANPESQVAAETAPPVPAAPAPEPVMPPAAPTVAALAPPLAAPDPMPAAIAPPPSFDPKNELPMTPPAAVTQPQEGMLVVHQLPYALRKELPKLELSMHVYSPVAEERFIVLNGKRFNLSSPAPGPELNLVDIVDDGAVLEFRGQRFLLPRVSY